MPGDVYELAYEQGNRNVDSLLTHLRGMRSQAGTLLSATGVILGLVADSIFSGKLTTCGVVVTVIAIMLVAAMCATNVVLWWPVKGTYDLSARDIIVNYAKSSIEETHKDLALHRTNHYDDLVKRVTWREWVYRGTLVGFAIVVVFLMLALWDARQ